MFDCDMFLAFRLNLDFGVDVCVVNSNFLKTPRQLATLY